MFRLAYCPREDPQTDIGKDARNLKAQLKTVPSNPTLNRTANGMPPWPRSVFVHHAPRGQGGTPSSAG